MRAQDTVNLKLIYWISFIPFLFLSPSLSLSLSLRVYTTTRLDQLEQRKESLNCLKIELEDAKERENVFKEQTKQVLQHNHQLQEEVLQKKRQLETAGGGTRHKDLKTHIDHIRKLEMQTRDPHPGSWRRGDEQNRRRWHVPGHKFCFIISWIFSRTKNIVFYFNTSLYHYHDPASHSIYTL